MYKHTRSSVARLKYTVHW